MKLTLRTTEQGLVYQRDDEHPVTMYGAAAGIGVQFDDELGTTVRAFSTAYLGVNCIGVAQGGKHRHFYIPTGTPITLDGTKVNPSKYRYPLHSPSDRVYQHHLRFRRASQANRAVRELARINIIAMHVRHSGHCRLLDFQTPYELGPIMRGVLYNQLQPASAFFNRQPRTYEPYSFFQRLTLGQVALITAVFLLFCAVEFLRLPEWSNFLSLLEFGYQVGARLSFTIAVAYISPDILGLAKSCGAFSQLRAMFQCLAETKIPMFQDVEGHTTASVSVADLVGIIWQFVAPLLIGSLIVNLLLLALHAY